MRALSLVLLAGCAQPSPRSAADYACDGPSYSSHPRAQQLGQALERGRRSGLPGLAAFVHSDEGDWAGSAGFADLDLQVPMQTCTRSRVASVTKMATALLVLKLADRGLIVLDDPVTQALSADTIRGIANADVATVRQLLSHTSGIAHGLDNSGIALSYIFNDPARARTMRDYLDGIRGLPPAFAPGQGWGYSNSNYNLLGVLVEAVTHQTFADALQAEVLTPLHLTASSYPDATGVARGYLDLHGDGELIDSSDYTLGTQTPAGGLVSTVFDLRTLVEAAEQEPRLSAQWFDVPASKAFFEGMTGYGLGLMRWQTRWGEAVGHVGELFGWQAWAFVLPSRHLTLVIVTNADFGLETQRMQALAPAMLDAALE